MCYNTRINLEYGYAAWHGATNTEIYDDIILLDYAGVVDISLCHSINRNDIRWYWVCMETKDCGLSRPAITLASSTKPLDVALKLTMSSRAGHPVIGVVMLWPLSIGQCRSGGMA